MQVPRASRRCAQAPVTYVLPRARLTQKRGATLPHQQGELAHILQAVLHEILELTAPTQETVINQELQVHALRRNRRQASDAEEAQNCES